MILMLISTCTTIIIGTALSGLNNEVKTLNRYLELAADIKPNFEESLSLYTETTKEAIEYVHSLRPEGETEYIEFIASIEEIAQNFSLDIDLQTVENTDTTADTDSSPSLEYEIQFYGSRADLTNFLEKLEDLDYYIRILNIDFERMSYAIENERISPNISINLKLYVK